MPSNAEENRKSRRAFLAAATAGVASLTVASATEQPAAAAQPAPSTVRDHLWIFTCPAGLDNDSLERGHCRGGSRMTPAEGAFFLDVPNLLLIRCSDLPKLPCDEHGRAKTSFEQYAISFQPLDRVVWSVVGGSGRGSMKELDYVLPLAREFPNISGIYLDDFTIEQKQADGRTISRPALAPSELKVARERLKSLGRPMDIWVTLYTYELLPKHPSSTESVVRRWPTFSTSSTC